MIVENMKTFASILRDILLISLLLGAAIAINSPSSVGEWYAKAEAGYRLHQGQSE